MRCPVCGDRLAVMDTRHGNGETYRRLRCNVCKKDHISVEYLDSTEDAREEYLYLKKKEIIECRQRKEAREAMAR